MKDQVDALSATGVAETFLNSTLGEKESRERLRGLFQSEYRLLYVAPERLMVPCGVSGLQAAHGPVSICGSITCIAEIRPSLHRYIRY